MTGFNFQEHEDILHTALEPSQRLYTHDQIPRQKINKLILNYFIQEGFPNAALSFSKEAQIDLKHDEESWVQLEKETKKFLTTPKISSQDFIDAVNNYLNSLTTNAPREDHAIEEKARDTIKGFSSIEKRKEIKYLVLKGDITKAIAAISTYFPSVLDSNNLLLLSY